MSNFVMALYLFDHMNIHHTYEKRDGLWVIETEDFQFWFDENGEYSGTVDKIPELEDY